MRAAFLSRSLLVIDEAHASDPYMTEIMASLVGRHVGLGGHVLLLSATASASACLPLVARLRSLRPAELFAEHAQPALGRG